MPRWPGWPAIATGHESTVEAVRSGAQAVLDDLIRHGQRAADLVHDAYSIDIGGE